MVLEAMTPEPIGSLKAKPLLFSGITLAEGAFRNVGVDDAQAERLLSMSLVRMMAAKAILEKHEQARATQ